VTLKARIERSKIYQGGELRSATRIFPRFSICRLVNESLIIVSVLRARHVEFNAVKIYDVSARATKAGSGGNAVPAEWGSGFLAGFGGSVAGVWREREGRGKGARSQSIWLGRVPRSRE
jgi:hypothetical protein